MLADTDSSSVDRLSLELRAAVERLESRLHLAGSSFEIGATDAGSFEGLDARHYYILQEGNVALSSGGRTICIFEPGEMLLPAVAGVADADTDIAFTCEEGGRVVAFPASTFLEEVLSVPETAGIWSEVLLAYGSLMTAVCADLAPVEAPEMGPCEMYGPGDTIIRQGDRADYVFSMHSGEAEVLVRGVEVGRIGQGELFGAMAALTHSDRSATVKALTDCVVEKVPMNQFSDLIRSNPGTIHALLVDMANSIVNLNQQLVGLRGPKSLENP